MRLFIVANIEKPKVKTALESWKHWIAQRCQVLGIDTDEKTDLTTLEADAVLVLGGDGTLLSAAQRLGGRPIPLMGVNLGRLGFLASFTPDRFQDHFEHLLTKKLPISRRQMLEVSVVSFDIVCEPTDVAGIVRNRRFCATALNDAVITAGPPFHMVELEMGIDGETGVHYFGDGVIVSTPSGSTAYSLSSGGPILSPGVQAFCITPICAHSLTIRPVVIPSSSTIVIRAERVNEGTTLFCDGHANTKLQKDDRVVIRRSASDVYLVENPEARQWKYLAEKLHWAIGPKYEAT